MHLGSLNLDTLTQMEVNNLDTFQGTQSGQIETFSCDILQNVFTWLGPFKHLCNFYGNVLKKQCENIHVNMCLSM